MTTSSISPASTVNNLSPHTSTSIKKLHKPTHVVVEAKSPVRPTEFLFSSEEPSPAVDLQ